MEPSAAAQSVSPSDPPQDQCVSNVEALLHAVGVLLTYGRHLVDTIRQRATTPNFNAIAACFGTANLSTILAHLNRGILRAAALERVLLARAATGKDIDFIERHPLRPEPQPAQHGSRAARHSAQAGTPRMPPRRLERSRTLHAHLGGT